LDSCFSCCGEGGAGAGDASVLQLALEQELQLVLQLALEWVLQLE